LPGYDSSSWYGLVMAAATPAPIVTRLSNDMMKALSSTDMRERLSNQGIDPVAGGADEFRKYLAAEIPKWAKVIREAKIPPQ
jgi:tripartite-type tricarboxylate transporter receptor subunit TctC